MNTFKRQASKLKKKSANQNPNGFQEVSAPGPRRGVGGEENSPMKKKNFYGGEAYFQDGYGGDLASPVKSRPITQKSRSPLKMNEALVQGAKVTGKKFIDVGAEVEKAFEEFDKKPAAADLSADALKDL